MTQLATMPPHLIRNEALHSGDDQLTWVAASNDLFVNGDPLMRSRIGAAVATLRWP
jgi:hypothetical protein